MITRPTVLVLGAGASEPFGFPTGRRLAREIIQQLRDPGFALTQLMRRLDVGDVDAFWHSLNKSAQPSVDAFVERRPEFTEIGKAAIAASLLPRELYADLFRDDRDTWYDYFVNTLPDDPTLLDKRLAIVTFNYDRSLLMYLRSAVFHRFGLQTWENVTAWLNHLPLIHVYGSLGDLPLGHNDGEPTVTAYGGDATEERVRRAAGQIRIMGERQAKNAELARAHEYLCAAERVVFLGFGYDATNVSRLLAYGPNAGQQFVGSAKGLTDGQNVIARRRLIEAGARQDQIGLDNDDKRGETLAYLRYHCWLE